MQVYEVLDSDWDGQNSHGLYFDRVQALREMYRVRKEFITDVEKRWRKVCHMRRSLIEMRHFYIIEREIQ